jgi:CRP-like cAMP-binding protein
VIELIGPGQSFAEAFVFLNRPYVVSAQVLTDTLLLNVSKQVVLAELAREPSFSLHMLAGISKRLHCLIQDVEGYALQSGMQRLIGYLLREAEACGSQAKKTIVVNLPASKATIASRLSLTPEYFSRVLHELETQTLIEINNRDIRILDIQKLAQFGSH